MKAYIAAGLFLGDEGKGSIVDWLCGQYAPQVDVIRYCGGPQAAHNICHAQGLHHTFAQFGSGMLNPGVRTHISRRMVIEPGDFIREAEALATKGINDVMNRLTIDGECVIMTPWHTALRRIQEFYWCQTEGRGHGTCGMGVGTAVDYAKDYSDAPRARDLLDQDILAKKLRLCQERLLLEAQPLAKEIGTSAEEIWKNATKPRILDTVLDDWLPYCQEYTAIIKDDGQYFSELEDSGRVAVLESTQGTLLDRRIGFLPYVTNSEVAISAARKLISGYLPTYQSKAIGIIRSYAVRHGEGPLPTAMEKIPQSFHDDFNGPNPWQGQMRFGWLDMVLLKYSINAGGRPDVLALTCIDQVAPLTEILVCTSYSFSPQKGDKEKLQAFHWREMSCGEIEITGIRSENALSKLARSQAAEILFKVKPKTWEKFSNGADLHCYLESELGVPIGILSMGGKNSEKAQIGNYL